MPRPIEDKPEQIESFTCEYWDFLRGKTDKPNYKLFGLNYMSAAVIATQCKIEHEQQERNKHVRNGDVVPKRGRG